MSATSATKPELSEQTLPWYRYGWPWFLISIPLVSVVLGCFMLYLAFNANNSLVVDDYYKEGKAYNLRIERDRLASLLGLKAALTQSSEGIILELDQQSPVNIPQSLTSELLAAEAAFEAPQTIVVRWVHVTQAERDGAAELTFIGGGRYIAPGGLLPQQGKFRLHVEPLMSDIEQPDAIKSDWRLISSLTGFDAKQSINIPAPALSKVFNRDALQ